MPFPRNSRLNRLWSSGLEMPLLVTVRCHEEGGLRRIPEEERFSLLRAYMPCATAIDIEIKSMRHGRELVMEAADRGILVIGSTHDFQITPGVDYLREQEKKARAYRADLVKFAFTPCVAGDIQTGVQLFKKPKGPIAVMGMGPMGPVSRLLYSQLGSCLVYGYLGDQEAAPGQWHVSLLKETLRNLGPILR
ncbi:MAG: type I 3-dehydroquinate dehydratase [Akkermansia sp.]